MKQKRATVVIGANYGDEGKGLVTDWLVNQLSDTEIVVVRFNGGAQAGHTVVTPEGNRHVFSHFGSGTLSGVGTYLAKHFVLNPILFYQEAIKLRQIIPRYKIRIAADPRCYVTTPYDMIINQIIEDSRRSGRHGSCGIGFGETIERNLYPPFRLTHADLGNRDKLWSKLEIIRDQWMPSRLGNLMPSFDDSRLDNRMLKRTVEAFEAFNKDVTTAGLEFIERKNIVFEGAQGLALDMDGPNFPHVTRSNTGLTNIVPLARALGLNLDVIYITRPYLTKHGAGPLPNEYKPNPPIIDETNTEHSYQGYLRFAPLLIEELVERIDRDMALIPTATITSAITCLDHVSKSQARELHGELDMLYPIRLTSHGPNRQNVNPVNYKEKVNNGVRT